MKQSANRNISYIVPALKKGLLILEMFSAEKKTLTINDFAERLGVSVSSIYRIVVTLTEMNYLKKAGRNSYELGPMVLTSGFCYLSSREIVQIAAPYLLELRDETSASCHLAVREGVQAVYIFQAQSPQRMAVNVPIGSRFACHTVAIGRALLTGLSDDTLYKLYAGIALDGYSVNSPTSLPQLKVLLAREKEQGYSINQSDYSTAIAAPLVDFAGQIPAAINVSLPDFIIEDPLVKERLTALLLETAREISAELGGGR